MSVDDFTTAKRRALLRGLGASALLASSAGFARAVRASPAFSDYPFGLGVASGDPAPDGFVIWTRIAPKPLERGGGMPAQPVEVGWTVATDERVDHVVRKGSVTARPELGHAVHVEIAGLEPARAYHYRFTLSAARRVP